jgi:hypothetical protein
MHKLIIIITACVFILVVSLTYSILAARDRETFDDSGAKTYVTCFAGRQQYLEILFRYIKVLHDRGLIHEFHAWNFTCDPNDEVWLQNHVLNEEPWFVVKHVNNKSSWSEYYAYYYDLRDTWNALDVLIKLDDDIVFIDVNAFPGFVDFRRRNHDCVLAFPSIINNDACAVYQFMYGLHPFDNIAKIGRTYDDDDAPLWKDGHIAFSLHEHFVQNMDDLCWTSMNIHDRKIIHMMGLRFSINFFAVLGQDLYVFKQLAESYDFLDDELNLTVDLCRAEKTQHYVDMHMLVAHAWFNWQRESGVDESRLLDMYTQLADRIL